MTDTTAKTIAQDIITQLKTLQGVSEVSAAFSCPIPGREDRNVTVYMIIDGKKKAIQFSVMGEMVAERVCFIINSNFR